MTTIDFARYREKVLGCWLGKAVGGTLGGPYEGVENPLDLHFYDPVPDTMLPNDDLDLQVVWVEAIRAQGLPIHRRMLADAWIRHIQLLPDEYGVAIRNLAAGIYPPASGAFDNGFTAGMGAAIRTELWACLAPGDPELACALMREDACVDHGPDGEGMYAAVYLAYLESAAFVDSDRETLLSGAQTSIPASCRVARAIADTRKWWAETGDWREVCRRVYAHHGSQNFTDVAQNLAFTILGWLAGKDFGEAICVGVNCGMDTDCTGATLGALLGILDPGGIGQEWLQPIGRDLVLSPGMVGMHAPATLDDFTDQVTALAVAVQGYYGAAVSLRDVPVAVMTEAKRLPTRTPGGTRARDLLLAADASPDEALLALEPLTVALTYPPGTALQPAMESMLTLRVSNSTATAISGVCISPRVPDGWRLAGESATFALAPGESYTIPLRITPPPASAVRVYGNPLDLEFAASGLNWRVSAGLPLTIPWRIARDAPVGNGCPSLPTNTPVIETPGHFVPLPDGSDNLLVVGEFQLPYHVAARFVLQTPKGVTLRAWLDDELLHTHEGGYQVPAIHRPGSSGKAGGMYKRGWHRLTIALSGKSMNDNIPSTLFVGIGDAATWDWVRGVEWRVPR